MAYRRAKQTSVPITHSRMNRVLRPAHGFGFTPVNNPTHKKPAPDVLHRYVVSGRSKPRWLLNNQGDTLRILDSQGSEVLRGALVPERFTQVGCTLLRSRDGTRALIFMAQARANATHIPEGRYRFEFNFAHHIGDDKPILKLGGSSAPEKASIEIEV